MSAARAVSTDVVARRLAFGRLEYAAVTVGPVVVPVYLGPWLETASGRRRCVWRGVELVGALLTGTGRDVPEAGPVASGAFAAALAIGHEFHGIDGQHEAEEQALTDLVACWAAHVRIGRTSGRAP